MMARVVTTEPANDLGREDALSRPLAGWLNGTLVLVALIGIVWLERKRPLRRRIEDDQRHDVRNLAMSVLSAAAIRFAEKPLMDRLTHLVQRSQWGLVKRIQLPPALEVVVAVVLLDYTLYVWQVLTHRAPFLWRFHRVHHADLDLTASTALRFHFAEMVLSVPWRAGQVLLIGVSPLSLSVWQTATLIAIIFHHSNLKLPVGVERRLCRLFVTPRMHGIHHSMVPEEANANWSTILSFPDYLHHTCRLNVSQQDVGIGVPEFRHPDELRLPEIVRMPFRRQRPFWKLPRVQGPACRPRATTGTFGCRTACRGRHSCHAAMAVWDGPCRPSLRSSDTHVASAALANRHDASPRAVFVGENFSDRCQNLLS
jgi:sterol desaturase/sphingolipid hydroxylase (fatty acid hydroxylase superfamily)